MFPLRLHPESGNTITLVHTDQHTYIYSCGQEGYYANAVPHFLYKTRTYADIAFTSIFTSSKRMSCTCYSCTTIKHVCRSRAPAAPEHRLTDYLEASVCCGSRNANVAGCIGSRQSATICSLGWQDSHSHSYVLWQMRNTVIWFRAAPCHSTRQPLSSLIYPASFLSPALAPMPVPLTVSVCLGYCLAEAHVRVSHSALLYHAVRCHHDPVHLMALW